MNEDFFETDKFPSAKFVSTKIETGKSGRGLMTGELTLHGETKEIQFPIEVQMKDGGLILQSKFKLDRSKFGMDQMLSGVDKMVDIEIVVGQPTPTTTEKPGHGGESKEKEARQRLPENLQLVSLYLPNMTWTGCEASVRSDLKAISSITGIETNLDEQTCSFKIDPTVDVQTMLDSLAKNNGKISDWKMVDWAMDYQLKDDVYSVSSFGL